MTPQENLDAVLAVCRERNCDEYTTYCTVLTAYSESDFNSQARSAKPTSSGFYSEGVFQQTLPWWKNDHWDVRASANAFIDQFRRITGVPERDCWEVQRWKAPSYNEDALGFNTALETMNYRRRIAAVRNIISTGK